LVVGRAPSADRAAGTLSAAVDVGLFAVSHSVRARGRLVVEHPHAAPVRVGGLTRQAVVADAAPRAAGCTLGEHGDRLERRAPSADGPATALDPEGDRLRGQLVAGARAHRVLRAHVDANVARQADAELEDRVRLGVARARAEAVRAVAL